MLYPPGKFTMGILAKALFIVLALVALIRVRGILPPFFLAVVIAYVLNPVVCYLQRRGAPRPAAIFMVYALIAVVLLGVLVYLVPVLISQLNRLADAIPQYTGLVNDMVRRFQRTYRSTELPDSVRQVVDDTILMAETRLVATIRGAVESVLVGMGQVLPLLISPVLAYYFLRDSEHILKTLEAAIPAGRRKLWLDYFAEVDRVLAGFIRGQLTLAIVIGSITALAMYLLGLRYFLLIGIVSGIGELIPYFGPIFAAVPAVLFGLLESPALGLKVLVVLVVIQQADGALIAPRILGAGIGLHPVVVIFSLFAGAHLFGFWGLVLAVPLTGILLVTYRFFLSGICGNS